MISGKLTQDNPESVVFNVYGDCFICAKGKGTVSVYRKVGANFELMTTDRGEEMTFAGDGVLFNNAIHSSKKLPHKLVGAGDIEFSITVEDR